MGRAVGLIGLALVCACQEVASDHAAGECLQIAIPAEEYDGWRVGAAVRPAWATSAGIHVLRPANQRPSESVAASARAGFFLDTYDPMSGKRAGRRLHEVALPSSDSVLLTATAAGAPDGSFTVSLAVVSDQGTFEGMLLGRIDTDSWHATVQDDWNATRISGYAEITWDGEALARHGIGSGEEHNRPRELYVQRVRTDGRMLLPFTRFAAIPPHYALSTDSVSGRTVVFALAASGTKMVAGHLRSGLPLPGMGAGPVEIAVENEPQKFACLPAVRALADGAWVLWRESADQRCLPPLSVRLLRLDAHGVRMGRVVNLPAPAGTRESFDSAAIWASDLSRASVVAARPEGLYEFIIDKNDQVTVQRLAHGLEGQASHIARGLQVLERDGVRWAVLTEARYEGLSTFRLMKLGVGCEYVTPRPPAR